MSEQLQPKFNQETPDYRAEAVRRAWDQEYDDMVEERNQDIDAQEQLAKYEGTQLVQDDVTGNTHDPKTGASVNPDKWHDQKRTQSFEESSPQYEDMSISELAGKMGEAMHYGDKTTGANVWEILSGKVDELVESAKSERDPEHSDLREAQIKERVAKMVSKRRDELDNQDNSSKDNYEDIHDLVQVAEDLNQDGYNLLQRPDGSSKILSNDEKEAIRENQDLIRDGLKSRKNPTDPSDEPAINDPIEDEPSEDDLDDTLTMPAVEPDKNKNKPFNVMDHFKREADKNKATFNKNLGLKTDKKESKELARRPKGFWGRMTRAYNKSRYEAMIMTSDPKEYFADEEKGKKRRTVAAIAGVAAVGLAGYMAYRFGAFDGNHDMDSTPNIPQPDPLAEVTENGLGTVKGDSPGALVDGFFQSFEDQGFEVSGLTPESNKAIVQAMQDQAMNLQFGTEINADGVEVPHIVDLSDPANTLWDNGKTDNAFASAEAAIPREQIEKFVRIAEENGVTITKN